MDNDIDFALWEIDQILDSEVWSELQERVPHLAKAIMLAVQNGALDWEIADKVAASPTYRNKAAVIERASRHIRRLLTSNYELVPPEEL